MHRLVPDDRFSQTTKICPTQSEELRSGAQCAALGSGDLCAEEFA